MSEKSLVSLIKNQLNQIPQKNRVKLLSLQMQNFLKFPSNRHELLTNKPNLLENKGFTHQIAKKAKDSEVILYFFNQLHKIKLNKKLHTSSLPQPNAHQLLF